MAKPKRKIPDNVYKSLSEGTTPDEMIFFMKNGHLPKSAMRSPLLKRLYKQAGIEPESDLQFQDLEKDRAALAEHTCTEDCDHAVAGTEDIVSTGQH